MTLNHNYGYFSSVGSGIAGNVMWLHDVAKSKRKHSIKQPTKQVQK